jgi:hypothetical protein
MREIDVFFEAYRRTGEAGESLAIYYHAPCLTLRGNHSNLFNQRPMSLVFFRHWPIRTAAMDGPSFHSPIFLRLRSADVAYFRL